MTASCAPTGSDQHGYDLKAPVPYRCLSRGLSNGAGQPAPVVAAAHLLFTDMASFQAAMAAAGKVVNADIRNYTSIVPNILISETLA